MPVRPGTVRLRIPSSPAHPRPFRRQTRRMRSTTPGTVSLRPVQPRYWNPSAASAKPRLVRRYLAH